jgi:hypothetical protein
LRFSATSQRVPRDAGGGPSIIALVNFAKLLRYSGVSVIATTVGLTVLSRR